MLLAGLLVKVGRAPVYQWFPAVVGGTGWLPAFVLITWQKVAPIVIVAQVQVGDVG